MAARLYGGGVEQLGLVALGVVLTVAIERGVPGLLARFEQVRSRKRQSAENDRSQRETDEKYAEAIGRVYEMTTSAGEVVDVEIVGVHWMYEMLHVRGHDGSTLSKSLLLRDVDPELDARINPPDLHIGSSSFVPKTRTNTSDHH